MNISRGFTNIKLLQQLIADKSIVYLLRCPNRYSSIYDINKLTNDSEKKDSKFLRNQHSIFGLAAPLLAFTLGTWQLQRLQWKTNLLKTIEDRMKQEVVPFPDDNLSFLDDLEYAKVQVKGEFLHDREFYVQPRQRFDKDEIKSKNRPPVNNFGSPGAQVITPFKLHPSGNVILVNRGWVPPQRITPESRAQGQVQGQVTFNAVVRHTEKRPAFIRRNDPDKGLWFYTDIRQMAEKYDTLPVLVDACYGNALQGSVLLWMEAYPGWSNDFMPQDSGVISDKITSNSSIQGGPIGGQTRVTHRNDHMMYACFWFSIGAATLFGWFL